MRTASLRTKSGNQLQCTAIERVEESFDSLVESDVKEPMAIPVLRPGYAGVMNRHGYGLQDEPREKALRDTFYQCLHARQEVLMAYASPCCTIHLQSV